MNRPPVENTCCHHECSNRKTIIKKAPTGDTEIINPVVVNVSLFSTYDIMQGQTGTKDEYNHRLKNEHFDNVGHRFISSDTESHLRYRY